MNYFMIVFLLLLFFLWIWSAPMVTIMVILMVWTRVRWMEMARLMVTQWSEFGLDRPTQPM